MCKLLKAWCFYNRILELPLCSLRLLAEWLVGEKEIERGRDVGV